MTAIAIFVKTPGHSPIKTRLAASVGQAKAEKWHCLASRIIAEKALATEVGPVYFAVAEDEAMDHPLWTSLPRMSQGTGGLGERMHHVHSQLIEEHGRALLLGADTIQWKLESLAQAHHWLNNDRDRLCIGPAKDGGFWTFGSNTPLPLAAWIQPRYSHESTFNDFIKATSGFGANKTLETLTDLDELADIDAVLAESRNNPRLRSCTMGVRFIEDELATHIGAPGNSTAT